MFIELFFEMGKEMEIEKMPTLNYNQKLILRATTDRSKHTFTTAVQYIGTRMNVQLPLAGFPDEVGDVSREKVRERARERE